MSDIADGRALTPSDSTRTKTPLRLVVCGLAVAMFGVALCYVMDGVPHTGSSSFDQVSTILLPITVIGGLVASAVGLTWLSFRFEPEASIRFGLLLMVPATVIVLVIPFGIILIGPHNWTGCLAAVLATSWLVGGFVTSIGWFRTQKENRRRPTS